MGGGGGVGGGGVGWGGRRGGGGRKGGGGKALLREGAPCWRGRQGRRAGAAVGRRAVWPLPKLTVPAGSVAGLLFAAALQLDAGAIQLSPAGDSPERFGSIESFEFTDARGRRITDQDLLGSPWVAVPFFVRCSGPCPSLTADLRSRVYEELQGTGARLVSFSVDPSYDTPEALAEYAARFEIDTESWLFLTGSEEAMGRFVRNGLKVPLDLGPRAEDATQEPEITHGTRLPVVDAEGQIAGWYRSEEHTSELQSRTNLVCRLLLEKKKKKT